MRLGHGVMAAALLIVGAGCGDDGRSLEDWAKEAAPACDVRAEVVKAISPPMHLTASGETVAKVSDALEKARAKAAEAEPPSAEKDADKVKAYDTAVADVIAAMRDWTSTHAGDDYGLMEEKLNVVMVKAKAVDEAAHGAGLKGCAKTVEQFENPIQKAGVTNIKDSFAIKANAMCHEQDVEFNKQMKATPQGQRLPVMKAFLDRRLTELRKLKPPLTNRAAFDAYLADYEALKAEYDKASPRTEADITLLEARIGDLFTKADAKATAYGLSDCGN